MLTTKELLRNAVSRAPLVTLHALSANLTGTNDTMSEGTNGAGNGLDVGVQGPDVRPPNFTTVVIEEEEEEEVVEIAVKDAITPKVVHAQGMMYFWLFGMYNEDSLNYCTYTVRYDLSLIPFLRTHLFFSTCGTYGTCGTCGKCFHSFDHSCRHHY